MNGMAIISWLVLALFGATMFLLPYFTPRRFFFTITVAAGFPASQAGRSILRGYHRQSAAIFVVSLLAVLAFPNAALALARTAAGAGRRGGVSLRSQPSFAIFSHAGSSPRSQPRCR
jgi:hypothetical protein